MDPLAPLVNRLQSEGRPRVWSLVMTVMGDSVHHRGGRIATGRLARLLARIGIESGAMRTALSRLARDGWVEGHRSGRTSSYALTAKGRAEVVPAAGRIYATPRQGPVSCWVFDTTTSDIPGIAIAGGQLRAGSAGPSAPGFAMIGQLAPDAHAAVAAALPAAQVSGLARLAADLDDLAAARAAASLAPLDAIAARTLLIHRWRRLVLRWPETPAEILPAPLTGRNLAQEVAQAYAALSPDAESWLGSALDDLPPLPEAEPGFATRFGAAAS